MDRQSKKISIYQDHLKTVLSSLDVIECIAAASEPLRLTDISKELDLSKSQVHRILMTLVHRKYIQQEVDSQRYSLGINSWLLGNRVSFRYPLLKIAKPILDRITHKETVYLALLDVNESFYLYIRDGTHPVRAVVTVGEHGPLHATATGKAMLAFQSPEFLKNYFGKKLISFTHKTITNNDILVEELVKTRKQGYSVVIDELEIGLSGIGSPILDKDNLCFAAVGISVPTYRFSDDGLKRMSAMAKEASVEISNNF